MPPPPNISDFSPLPDPEALLQLVLNARRQAAIIYVRRPLPDAFRSMLERAETEKRLVSIAQMIHSDRGAAATVTRLCAEFASDQRVAFRFVANSSEGVSETSADLASPFDYTEIRKALHAILDSEYRKGNIGSPSYFRIGGEKPAGN